MTLTHLKAETYRTEPWKNGLGETDEIHLAPEGATRERFGLRVSSAPIPQAAAFSAFHGVERYITVIAGDGLELDFGGRVERLPPLSPFRFDSGLAPVGRPLGAGVRVVNVMAAREAWTLREGRVLSGAERTAPGPRGLAVLFAVSGRWRIAAEGAEIALGPRDTGLIGGPAQAAPDGEGHALLIRLEPAA